MSFKGLFRRSSSRFALSFGLIFSITIIVSFTSVYWRLATKLRESMHAEVMADRKAMVKVYRKRGYDELKEVVHFEAISVPGASALFLLQDKSHRFVEGNIRDAPHFIGWKTLKGRELNQLKSGADDQFLLLWTKLDEGWLLIGANKRNFIYLQKMLEQTVILAVFAILLITLLFGIWIAHRAQRRIDSMSNALSLASQGKLSTRLPVSKAGDDLDFIADKVNLTLERLELAVERVNHSTSDIAHDLKRPLSRLRLQLEAALDSAIQPSQVQSRVREAILNIDAIVETFEALLRIAQIEAGERRSRLTHINIANLVRDISSIYAPVVEDAGHSWTLTVPDEYLPEIIGDQELLVQLFANLIENAIHHCPPPGQIGLALYQDAQGLVAEVTDSGPGIPKSEYKRVFNRFYRLDKSRTSDHNGLGLALVAAICELHEARIELSDNAPGLHVRVIFASTVQNGILRA